MFGQQPEVVNVAAALAALGIGLLIGLKRERRKATGGGRAPGGVRIFTLSALLGAVAMVAGQQQLLAVAALCVGGFALLSYARARDQDPGTTTEIALVLTVMLGGLAVERPVVGRLALGERRRTCHSGHGCDYNEGALHGLVSSISMSSPT